MTDSSTGYSDIQSKLLALSRDAAAHSYSPYSHFRVGAAVIADGKIYTGTNIENGSYGLTICAERVAIFKAIAEGHRKISALAVSCVDAKPNDAANIRMPCGACRQVLQEFANPDALIAVDGVGSFPIEQLFPLPFQLDE